MNEENHLEGYAQEQLSLQSEHSGNESKIDVDSQKSLEMSEEGGKEERQYYFAYYLSHGVLISIITYEEDPKVIKISVESLY